MRHSIVLTKVVAIIKVHTEQVQDANSAIYVQKRVVNPKKVSFGTPWSTWGPLKLFKAKVTIY